MSIFFPEDGGGSGTVTVDDVDIQWTITIVDPEIPTQIRNADPDDPHGLPYAEHIPFAIRFDMTQSVGGEMVLSIEGFAPVINTGDKETWTHTQRFVREGIYHVHLAISGGNILKDAFAIIEALPVAPLDSDRVVIRIQQLSAVGEKHEVVKFYPHGDQA